MRKGQEELTEPRAASNSQTGGVGRPEMSVFVVGQTPDDMVQGQATIESTSAHHL